MPSPLKTQADSFNEREWRHALVEIEQLRQEYARRLSATDRDGDERAIGRAWLRLWQAERRRDELLRRAD